MANFQNVLILAVLCILAGALTQASEAEDRPPQRERPILVILDGPYDNDMPGWEAPEDEDRLPYTHEESSLARPDGPHDHDIPEWFPIVSGIHWTPCDITVGPRKRCHDCRTTLVCTLFGGLVIECPDGSYCHQGVCSHIPSEKCLIPNLL